MRKLFIPIAISALFLSSCSDEKRLVRKAGNAIDQSDFEKALSYYDQVLAKDSNSFRANAGKGIVLADFMGRYDQAIPYLEKAQKNSPEEVKPKINNDLGKSYQYIGNYPRALYYYGKVTSTNNEDNPYYDVLLTKRIADCKFAIEHPEVAPSASQSYKNLGSAVNSDAPEYGPLYNNGTLIFSSKRKDSPKEKKNNIDGRFFESMYITQSENGKFISPRRYTLPDLGENSSFHKGNESAVTMSENGKTLYVFRSGELYEADLTHPTEEPKKLAGRVNFLGFEPYVFVTHDGKMMFLVRDTERNGSGTDIYQSFKRDDGTWSKPLLLPFNINTEASEDAPYMTEDGTLFFASNGLPGYGGYDIYKTKYVNGQWTNPVNIGQPLNTPGDEIYFTLNPNSANGYYTSTRQGGFGDMDIYSVHYVDMSTPECMGMDSMFVITEAPTANPLVYTISADVPKQYSTRVQSISWTVNGILLPQTSPHIDYTFADAGKYKVTAKAVIYCDTCPALIALCSEKEIETGTPAIVSVQPEPADVTKVPHAIEKNTVVVGELTDDQLSNIGWNTNPCFFDFNKSTLRDETKTLLDQNIKVLKAHRELSLTINGYADCRDTEQYNKNLSAHRAYAVKSYMMQHGVASGRIIAVNAFGESQILNGCVDNVNCTEEQHQANRKVDFKVSNNHVMYTISLND